MNKIKRTPVSFYGSKHNMLKYILPLIPRPKKLSIYIEPMFGSGTVFFAKPQFNTEVINDTNDIVVNFFRVLQDEQLIKELDKMIKLTLHSRSEFYRASEMYANPHNYNEVKKAWCFFVLCNMSFGSKLKKGGWAYGWNSDDTANFGTKYKNKREAFSIELFERMRTVQIDCIDANKIIKKSKSPDIFMYLDPPYISADMGHYKGTYSPEDFEKTLKLLSKAPFRWLLSSYPEEVLMDYRSDNDWNTLDTQQNIYVSNKYGKKRKKIECLTYNYNTDLRLFNE